MKANEIKNYLQHQDSNDVALLNQACNKNSRSGQKFCLCGAEVENKINLDDIDFKFLNDYHQNQAISIDKYFKSIRKSDDARNTEELETNIKEYINFLGDNICEMYREKTKQKFIHFNLSLAVSSTIVSSTFPQTLPINLVFNVGSWIITDILEPKVGGYKVKKQKQVFKDMEDSVKVK